jgi:hypothetical protein
MASISTDKRPRAPKQRQDLDNRSLVEVDPRLAQLLDVLLIYCVLFQQGPLPLLFFLLFHLMSWLKQHPPTFFLLIALSRFTYFAYSDLCARLVLLMKRPWITSPNI